jgi:acetyl esterase/lipase
VPAYAAPAQAQDLSGLSPTFVDVGSTETFRDEAVACAPGSSRRPCRAELHVRRSGFHGFAPPAAVAVAARSARVPLAVPAARRFLISPVPRDADGHPALRADLHSLATC